MTNATLYSLRPDLAQYVSGAIQGRQQAPAAAAGKPFPWIPVIAGVGGLLALGTLGVAIVGGVWYTKRKGKRKKGRR